MNTNEQICSCGCTDVHVIAYRPTADDRHVAIHSDGSITVGRTKLGSLIKGLGRPFSKYTRARRKRAVMLILDDIELYTLAEIPAAVRIAESTIGAAFTAGDDARRLFVRRGMAKHFRGVA
jgi:hypothetical protein